MKPIQEPLIYLDNNSTTQIDSRVLNEMMPFLTYNYANASSSHQFGVAINETIKDSRSKVAAYIKANPEEIVFTSGSTEAINLALKGLKNIEKPSGNHIVTLSTEHSAMLDCCKYLSSYGYDVTILPVRSDGIVDTRLLRKSIKKETILVSVMTANNEIGVIQPINEISQIAHEGGAVFFTDATQAVGKIPIDVVENGIDLMCISAHKFYGPKGIGAIYVKNYGDINFSLTPMIHGGGHERGLRSGTLNVAGIVGLAKACDICANEMDVESKRIKALRDKLETSLLQIENTFINGTTEKRLPNVSNICFMGVDSEALIIGLKNIMVSNGSACTSTSIYPSHVLKALCLSDSDAYSSIRFSLGRFNTDNEIDETSKRIAALVKDLRNMKY